MSRTANAALQVEMPLSERYSRMANEALEDRPADPVLRTLDVAISALGLLALAPVMATVALAVRLTSPGPALYRGLRVSRGGQLFTMYKFRTLRLHAETRIGGYLGAELMQLTIGEVTPVGHWLRNGHLDELPQLWNVLRGEMSIVGPRPIRPQFFDELCHQIPQYWQRLVIRPGITGFAQLRLGRELSWHEKLAHDLEYIADRSVVLYLSILGATARRVLAALPRAERLP